MFLAIPVPGSCRVRSRFPRPVFVSAPPLIKKRPDISGRRSWVVRIKGLEPPRRKASDPKSDVATNYTISANRKTGRHAADEERENPDSGLRQPERRFIFGKDRIKNANRTPGSAESPVFYLFLHVDNIVSGAPDGAAFPKSAPVLLGYAGRGAVRLSGRRVRSPGARPVERCRAGKMLRHKQKVANRPDHERGQNGIRSLGLRG